MFYRGTNTLKLLSQLEGRRLAIGSEGSGTRALALALLQTNGIAPGGDSDLEALDAEDLELSPFNQRGGLGKAHQLFGDKLLPLLDELNQTLAA